MDSGHLQDALDCFRALPISMTSAKEEEEEKQVPPPPPPPPSAPHLCLLLWPVTQVGLHSEGPLQLWWLSVLNELASLCHSSRPKRRATHEAGSISQSCTDATSFYFSLFHFISFCFILFHFILYHFILKFFISFHFISFLKISFDLI